MVIRIRWQGPGTWGLRRYQGALALASLLAPSALLAFSITLWRLAFDFRWTENFFVSTGVLSHWQSWLMLSGVLYLAFWLLNRYVDGQQHDALAGPE
jgi:hypothetical protein